MQDFLEQFEFIKSKYDDGSGFWDEYKRKAKWLDTNIEICIAARNMSADIQPLLEKFMCSQTYWDSEFKRFAAKKLLSYLKNEWDDRFLTTEDIIKSIRISAITFGYESKWDFGIWFSTGSEHGVQVYGDIQGNLIYAAFE